MLSFISGNISEEIFVYKLQSADKVIYLYANRDLNGLSEEPFAITMLVYMLVSLC